MLLHFLALLPVLVTSEMTSTMDHVKNSGNGSFDGTFAFKITEEVVGWEAVITFSTSVNGLTSLFGDEVKKTSTGSGSTVHYIVNKDHTGIQHKGTMLRVTVHGTSSDGTIPTASAVLKNMGHDDFKPTQLLNKDGTKYNYDEVLQKSILFYAAQRSGKLPADNPIPWRADSALNDRGNNVEDLTGGWYDAGDHVKFGFPQASAVTMLTWGLYQYKDAYQESGQLDAMYDCIRWPLEWLIKCHTGDNELYFQVGDGYKDHQFWGRPEDMTMDRPAFKITSSKPGSDIAGEYAAAMAIGSIVFKEKDPAFSDKLLKHAKEIYKFGKTYPGLYTKSHKDAGNFYGSGEFEDEMSQGAAMLYLATNTSQYLTDAEAYFKRGPAWGQSWENKFTGCMILLYKITKKDIYKQDIERTFTNWLPGATGPSAVPYTPKGLAFRTKWGSLRHVANQAFMALLAAEAGLHPTEYRNWAKSQIGYILGDAGRSYVVGFGVNPPSHEHHRASSCPMIPAGCSQDMYQATTPNPHTLYGGLVGGPGMNDEYYDVRSDYVRNEVAVDYNAGFQSAVAGLKSLHLRHILDK